MCMKYINTNTKPGKVQSPDDVFFPASARQMKASLSVRLVEEYFSFGNDEQFNSPGWTG